ncbi:MAG TPA: 8-amino-7-oxononanoate synthase [Polyangia bacterium]|nr:8-amino-7-oxononanoate synthase [Polyangia bacterium]
MRDLDDILTAELAGLDRAQARRACPELSGRSRVRVAVGGRPALSFASNDYLGLAGDPRVATAAAQIAEREGYGASAARLVSGDLPAHRELEAALASFLGRPAALVFPSGYQANMGVLAALAGPDDLVVSDALNHASLIDGCRLSRTRVAVFPHGDVRAAASALASAPAARRRLLVTESLFSMDGDSAPLAGLAQAAREHDAILVVDEAHAIGVHGPAGRGLCAAAGIVPDVLVGTLGKALGASGGFVTGSAVLRDYLVNRARTFIFTTALPAPVAAAAARALEIAAGPEGDLRRARLAERGQSLAASLAALRPPAASGVRPLGPIYPFVLGDNDRALRVSAALRGRSIFVPAIRPPTVPPGTARLRITLSAAHEADDLRRLTDALAELAP